MRIRAWHPLAVGLLAVPLSAAFFTPPSQSSSTHPRIVADAGEEALLGLWQATSPEKEGDPVRFYYFHNGGIGLVRYGKMGLTYTRSFHWRLTEGRLALVFMKDGRHHQVDFALENDAATLHLPDDPAFPGDHRYQRDLRPRGLDFHEGDDSPLTARERAEHPLARLWIQPTRDRRGGEGFRMYQLQAPTIDGRGVGWYHEGDMTEWSTETLTYRRTGDTMELTFPVRGERFTTPIGLEGEGAQRTLTLREDPRNFWHERTYRDGGPGFTVALEGIPLPYRVPGHGPHRPLGVDPEVPTPHHGCGAH